jgi:hypothetical protein
MRTALTKIRQRFVPFEDFRRQGMGKLLLPCVSMPIMPPNSTFLGTFDNGRRRGARIGKGRELNWIVPPRNSRLDTALAPMARSSEH